MDKRILKYIILTILVIITVTFGIVKYENKAGISQIKTPDIQKLLGEFLSKNQAPEQVREAYQFALDNPDNILDQIPCYCGCLQSNTHKNNRECFIKNEERQKKGDHFDKMGLNCGTCVNIALTTKNLKEQVKLSEEIKEIIDNQFKPKL